MKFLSALLLSFLLIFAGCAGTAIRDENLPPVAPVKADITITIVQEDGAVAIKAEADNGEVRIAKGMEVENPGLELSPLSAMSKGRMFSKIFSGISVADVTRLWNDLIYYEENYLPPYDVQLFIDSPGGDAFSGLALADQIEKYQKRGFVFTAHATGIVASAAVPVFAVCDITHATPATIFMVHEAALWKWPGRESASTIRAQTRLMDLLQELYLNKLVANSNRTFEQWVEMEMATSWFGRDEAFDLGILDIKD